MRMGTKERAIIEGLFDLAPLHLYSNSRKELFPAFLDHDRVKPVLKDLFESHFKVGGVGWKREV